ncbi:hypothetical protein PoB_004934600 [Plakobranchus ocellatus]|uniref:Uncharacterized protein n=1 Tax=Plakobranchus ocellatus TaxID=259542 RepID=A0AAV4BHM5_9GAST|nr:hypothetical protein PoB_004934600 [Plakobranchus ocellatus]
MLSTRQVIQAISPDLHAVFSPPVVRLPPSPFEISRRRLVVTYPEPLHHQSTNEQPARSVRPLAEWTPTRRRRLADAESKHIFDAIRFYLQTDSE